MMEMVSIAQMEIVRIAKKVNSLTITPIVELFPFLKLFPCNSNYFLVVQFEPFLPFRIYNYCTIIGRSCALSIQLIGFLKYF